VANRTHGIPHDVDQLRWLHETFPQLEVAVGTVPHELPSDNPILVRTELFESLDRGYLAFDEEGRVIAEGVDPRILHVGPSGRIKARQAARHIDQSFASWVVLRELRGGRELVVYNLHLDARSPNLRRRSVSLVIQAIEHLEHMQMPVVVLGDFNSFRGSPPVRALTEIGLVPVIEANRQGTFHFGLGVTLWPRIDHILVSRDLHIVNGYIERHSHEGVYPSDHYPVFAELESKAS
jgi:hypothetical protein